MNEQRNWDVYPGKKRKFNWLALTGIVLVLIVGSLLLAFSAFQKYIVYRQDGLYIDLPFMENDYDSGDELDVTRDPVDAELSLDGYDFSNVKTNAGEGTVTLKAMYVTYDQINDESLQEYVSRAKLNNANGLVLQVKPESGYIVYPSGASLAAGYGLIGFYDLATQVVKLREQGMYLVADVTCLLDSAIVRHYMGTCLSTATGAPLTTESGYWMDPYNTEYREYLVELCTELINMGFDEIMFSYASHPAVTDVVYSQTMSTPPTAESAISSFAIYMEKALGDICPLGLRVSYEALNGGVGSNGQNMEVLGKVFDRIYCTSTSNTYENDLAKAKEYMNTTNADRFVPYGYSAPTDSSWMLLTWVDTGED